MGLTGLPPTPSTTALPQDQLIDPTRGPFQLSSQWLPNVNGRKIIVKSRLASQRDLLRAPVPDLADDQVILGPAVEGVDDAGPAPRLAIEVTSPGVSLGVWLS
jgi:hypothetical protein